MFAHRRREAPRYRWNGLGSLGIAFALALQAGPVPNGGDEIDALDPMVLRWIAPAECPTQRDVGTRVRALVGPETSLDGRAHVQVVRRGSRFDATVSLQTDAGATTRSLGAEDCTAVADAVALVIAVGLDPLAVSTVVRDAEAPTIVPPPETPPREPDATPTRARATDPPRVRAPASPSPERPELGLRGFTQGAAAIGVLPRVGAAVGGGLALRMGAARLELSGAHQIGRSYRHPDVPRSGALVDATVGRAAACWTPTTGRFIFPLCAGAELGVMTARGRGLADRGTARTIFATAVPHVRALWFPTWRVGFGPALEVPIALTRPRFRIDDAEGDFVRAGSLGVRVGLAVEVAFFDESRRSRR